MTTEEGKSVLRLLSEGKIDADQAFRLLRALGDIDGAPSRPAQPEGPSSPEPPLPPGLGRRVLRIQVIEGGNKRVNVAIPLAIARLGKTKLAASGLVRGHLQKFGIDLDEVLRSIAHPGPVVDIADGEDRVLITVE
jgi:hypothetical protein